MDSKRVVTGLIIGFSVLFALMAGGVWLTAMVFAFVYFASTEYVSIMEHKGFTPSLKIMLTSSLLFAIIAYFNRFDLVALVFTVTCVLALMRVLFRGKQPYIANVATTILGFVYCGWFPLHLIFLRDLGSQPVYHYLIKQNISPEGAGYSILLFFGVLLTDTYCYYFGKQWGKNKLCPVISPNKTIEGSVAGTTM